MKNISDITSRILSLLRRAGTWLIHNFGVSRSEACDIATNGLIRQNPTFVLLLGMCPALAVTTSLPNGIGMGLATAAVLVCSNLTVSLLRTIIPDEIRITSYLIIIVTYTTAADLLMQAFLPDLSEALGLYTPLIAVNSAVLSRVKVFAADNLPGKSLLDGLFSGLGFTAALAILGCIREILGSGTIWGSPVPLFSTYPVGLILSPCGGFIVLGCLIALAQFIRRSGTEKRKRGDRHESC